MLIMKGFYTLIIDLMLQRIYTSRPGNVVIFGCVFHS